MNLLMSKLGKCYNLFLMLVLSGLCFMMTESYGDEPSEESDEAVHLGEVTVQGERLKDNIDITPDEISINLEEYKKAGVPHTVLDVLKDRAIIDFRGSSDLSAGNDDIQMRGFDTRQFTTAVDGLAIQKSGGYWGGHFVDYSIIPMEQIEKIEILPGPHSALYEGKSFGGALNIVTKAPKKRDAVEADFKLNTSFASLATTDHSMTVAGGGGVMDYVVGVREYHSDGYLKNTEYDLSTVSGQIAWLLPNDGYISLLGSYSDKKNHIACENDPNSNYYDGDYPVVERGDVSDRWRNPALEATRQKKPHSFRLNWKQPTELGVWTLGAYYSYDNQEYVTTTSTTPMAETEWTSWGVNIRDDVYVTDNHLVTFGFDTANINSRHTQEIVRTYAWFIQDQWQVTPRISLKPGLRYETITIWWSNSNSSWTGYAFPEIPMDYIPRDYDEWLPKFFASYRLDDLASFLRDTSVSVGFSRLWSPRSTCEVCTWGSGFEMDPAEGYGLDMIFQRRVWRDVTVMMDISRSIFDNYIVWAPSSTDYFQNSPWGRRMVGLEDIVKDGIEMEINGNLTDKLSMNISFAYVDWKYEGPKGGIEEMSTSALSNRAKYRINSAVTYNLTERLQFHLDYKHQDKQEQEVIDVIDENTGEFDVRTIKIDSYGVMDFSVSYRIFDQWKYFKDPTVKIFANNALDKDYVNTSGYPADERTYGMSFNMAF